MKRESSIARHTVLALLLFGGCLGLPANLIAQVAEPELDVESTDGVGALPVPHRLALTARSKPLAELGPAITEARAQMEEIALWNQSNRFPLRNGFVRALGAVQRVSLDSVLAPRARRGAPPIAHGGGLLSLTSSGDLVWGSRVRVSGANRLRMQLFDVALPRSARLWVYGETGESMGPFGTELVAADGTLWSPSVGGESIHLEVSIPARDLEGQWGLTVGGVLELFALGAAGEPLVSQAVAPAATDCLIDAECVDSDSFDVIEPVRHAIALIQFVKGQSGYLCSGGLLVDTVVTSAIPYFLTANHCIDSQSVASTLEAFWDYYTDGCLGSLPDLGSLPRSSGSTLRATGTTSDFTLLELSSVPSGRTFLGWNANTSAVPSGTALHRVSHPMGRSQQFSITRMKTSSPTCSVWPRPAWMYEESFLGGTFGGSSGSPVILQGGYVVGQLSGGCGFNPSDGCDPDNFTVDGALSQYYPEVAEYLNPATCYSLTRAHTGSGSDPVAAPTSSPGCPANQYLAGQDLQLTAGPAAGWEVDNWSGTNNDASHSLTNSLTMPAISHKVTVDYSEIPVPTDLAAVEVFFRDQPGNAGDIVSQPSEGQQVYPYFSFSITAPGPLTGTLARFELDGQELCSYVTTASPGSHTTWCATPWTATVGAHALVGKVDPLDQFFETTGANNRTQLDFTTEARGWSFWDTFESGDTLRWSSTIP